MRHYVSSVSWQGIRLLVRKSYIHYWEEPVTYKSDHAASLRNLDSQYWWSIGAERKVTDIEVQPVWFQQIIKYQWKKNLNQAESHESK